MTMETSSKNMVPPSRDRRPDAMGSFVIIPDEIICSILSYLLPRDVARLSSVSSVMYIFCNEEPLWMNLCLSKAKGQLQYKGSWKKTALFLENVREEFIERCTSRLRFDGFGSLFLLRRMYRCYTNLHDFDFDNGNVQRNGTLTRKEFSDRFDAQKPVLLTGLASSWPASSSWTIDQLSEKYGDISFNISQMSAHKISMKFSDYVSYMKSQHDEDPLYIFDNKFGESASSLLKDYSVPHLFQEDWFDVLDEHQRPPYRWLVIGPQRSGASWHVDPSLTSAWNTLLCGRKRWALYPPGRVPFGVTVHVNDEDGDVNVNTPTSIQWWLDYYPFLHNEEKPIECTQLPGETIFIPSGWWHCVLNLEDTVAVTQNFVNSKNFEYVCLDMAPGYRQKGVCRAGLMAVEDDLRKCRGAVDEQDNTKEQKKVKFQKTLRDDEFMAIVNGSNGRNIPQNLEFFYEIKFLSMFLDKECDHFCSPWCPGNSIGQRDLRDWLYKLWIKKPEMRPLIWKGSCLAINSDRWYNFLEKICIFHNIALPLDDERLPVGYGSNPVYLVDDYAIKFLSEGGLETAMYGLGSELQFYQLLNEVKSTLKRYIPEVVGSGIISSAGKVIEFAQDKVKGLQNMLTNNFADGFAFDVWSKKHYEYKTVQKDLSNGLFGDRMLPYLITKRCNGMTFYQIRDKISWYDTLQLASFLGEQLRCLHSLPCPALEESTLSDLITNHYSNDARQASVPPEWKLFVLSLSRKKLNASRLLKDWGDPIPISLIQLVEDYLPNDFTKFTEMSQGGKKVYKPLSWIHSDVMDDNVQMQPYSSNPSYGNLGVSHAHEKNPGATADDENSESWRPSHILDFSDISVGDRLLDIIPIYVDIFRGDPRLLQQFLVNYKLPLGGRGDTTKSEKFERLSYHAMCYCILHEENILGAIFSLWKELSAAKSWEEVELTVWGVLNNYVGIV